MTNHRIIAFIVFSNYKIVKTVLKSTTFVALYKGRPVEYHNRLTFVPVKRLVHRSVEKLYFV